MKNKNIKTQLYLFLLFLIVALFCFGEKIFAQTIPDVIFSAVQTSGLSSNDDFIELYNTTCVAIDLSDWKIIKKTKTGITETPIGTLKKSIPAKGYFLWENIKDGLTGVPDYTTKTYYLSDDYSIALFNKDEKQIDSITWGINQNPFANTLTYSNNPKKLETLKRSLDNIFSITENYSPKDSSLTEIGEIALCQKTEPPKEDLLVEKNYSDKIIINELFPAPTADSGNEEFIELYNLSEKDENLSGWILRDSSKTGKYTFPESITIKTKSFLVVAKKDFEFALNNSGGEKVLLFNPAEKEISRVEYTSSAKTNYSYAFNGTAWQWTSKATKGAENKFDEVLSGEIKKDKIIYVNMYANFEATTDDKAKHFTWNFGDGHKSYLKKTRHKYEKTGRYLASLKVTGEGADNLINFEVVVEKFGKAKVQIISLSPNPKGLDSKNEWLEILNATKKKIDLKGWSVATGWKNLANHPITKKFILKSGEARKLTRDFCAFSLGNKQAKIELRYPDGKVADKIKYDRKDDSIAEDEIYQKENADWQWLETQKVIVEEKAPALSEEIIEKIEPKKETVPEEENKNNFPEINQENADFDLADLGKYSEDPIWRQKQARQNALLFAGSNISPEKILFQNQSRVLGASSIIIPATKNSDQFWKRINAKLNEFIWFF
ncbi:MAG: lamin tail domain-containing protein [Candidatus Moraniibacteriota bacterium]